MIPVIVVGNTIVLYVKVYSTTIVDFKYSYWKNVIWFCYFMTGKIEQQIRAECRYCLG